MNELNSCFFCFGENYLNSAIAEKQDTLLRFIYVYAISNNHYLTLSLLGICLGTRVEYYTNLFIYLFPFFSLFHSRRY